MMIMITLHMVLTLISLGSSSNVNQTRDNESQRYRRSAFSSLCDHGDNWCEHSSEYPSTFIKQIFNSSHPLWYLMQQNAEQTQYQPHHHRHLYRHSHRQPRLLQETSHPACELLETFIRPRAARNVDLEWRFIVNDLESEETEYQQVVRVGQCTGAHECTGSWPGQITQCRQQYLDHKLVVMSMSGEVLLDTFNFPSCCACHVLNIQY